jgi:hypothetical protein
LVGQTLPHALAVKLEYGVPDGGHGAVFPRPLFSGLKCETYKITDVPVISLSLQSCQNASFIFCDPGWPCA